jgi:hypothetical protein
VVPRACLDDMEKRKFFTLPGLEFRRLGRPARSQSLYRLSYPGSIGYRKWPVNNLGITISSAAAISCADHSYFVLRVAPMKPYIFTATEGNDS